MGLEKYVAGASNNAVVVFEYAAAGPGIYIFDVSMDSSLKGSGKVHLSIDGSGAYDTQSLGADGHVLFLFNLKSVESTGDYYYIYCDHSWTFKSLEVSQVK